VNIRLEINQMMMEFSKIEGAVIMLINVSESILWQFRSCFSRKAAIGWFVIVVMAFIIRCDHYGVSSVVRWLFLNPDYQWSRIIRTEKSD
jgi:hypothetical protein